MEGGMILRINGVKAVRAKGKTYYYHRRTTARLPGQPGSEEFMRALARLDAEGAAPAAPDADTLGALMEAYRASAEYAALAPRTRDDYQRVFDRLAANSATPLADITRDGLYELRDLVAAGNRRHAANFTI